MSLSEIFDGQGNVRTDAAITGVLSGGLIGLAAGRLVDQKSISESKSIEQDKQAIVLDEIKTLEARTLNNLEKGAETHSIAANLAIESSIQQDPRLPSKDSPSWIARAHFADKLGITTETKNADPGLIRFLADIVKTGDSNKMFSYNMSHLGAAKELISKYDLHRNFLQETNLYLARRPYTLGGFMLGSSFTALVIGSAAMIYKHENTRR